MKDGFFDKFHIGTYCLQPNARDESHVRELSECGIDLLFGVNNDKGLLDLLGKHGVGAVVNGVVPGWFGGNGTNAGTMASVNPIERYLAPLATFNDHPAIVGIDIGDEPSALDLPHCALIAKSLGERLPDKLLYLNVYPSYGMLASAGEEQARRELGTESYTDYLRAYLDTVPLPYLSIDHYPYSSSLECLLSDLCVAAALCREYEKPLMLVLQVNSHVEGEYLTLEQLRLEARCGLAYGARVISWACYSRGWWHSNVLDKDGKKTEQYEKLGRVNSELRAIAEDYDRCTYQRTHRLSAGDIITTPLGSISTSAPLLVGEFITSDGSPALLLAPLGGGEKTSIGSPYNIINEGNVTLECSEYTRLSVRTPSVKAVVNGEKSVLGLKNEPILLFPDPS